MKPRLKICTDPKHLAWVSWSLLSNNPVNKSLYLLFSLIDLVIMMYYSFNLTQRVHFSNFNFSAITQEAGFNQSTNAQMFNLTSSVYELNSHYKQGGIKLSFLRQIDYQLNNLIRENNAFLLYVSGGILALNTVILSVLLIMALVIKNHDGLEKTNIFKRLLTLILVAFQTFLNMPLFDVLVRTMISASQ
jgi:hypothetical protein